MLSRYNRHQERQEIYKGYKHIRVSMEKGIQTVLMQREVKTEKAMFLQQNSPSDIF